MAALCAHYFDYRIVIVSTRWMYWNASWLVNDNYVIILMYDTDRQVGDRRFMAMKCMRYNISIFDEMIDGFNRLSIYSHHSSFYGIFLVLLGYDSADVEDYEVDRNESAGDR